jgi:allophanate hydrolase subunit 2
MTGLGGFGGRTLRKGDVLELGHASELQCAKMNNVNEIQRQLNCDTIRVTKGLEEDWFNDDSWDSFLNNQFSVSQAFSRMGIRMEGTSIESSSGHEILTQGVPLGAVQVPGNGQPIISFVEHQTTGGYPRIANVISADLCKVGQLKPGDRFQFALVSMAEAEQLYLKQMDFFHNLSAL